MHTIRELLERLRCANRSYNFDYICGVGTNSEAYSYEKQFNDVAKLIVLPNRSYKFNYFVTMMRSRLPAL